MSRIRRLPPSLIKRIAAGEVVERPASVVKELVENSLDAGASCVVIRVEDGGKSLIEVSDNGTGMGEEEAFLAVERHTTSKISSEEDLGRISTLGFRGEALYAISSVSVFTLITRRREDELAARIKIEGGILKGVDRVYRAEAGTTVRVERLFFNLRARRRFLRSKRIEQEHVRRIVKEYAIAYPKVAFKYWEGEELLYNLPQEGPEERIKRVLGGEILAGLSRGMATLYLVSTTTSDFYFFVNGRAVSDRSLMLLIRGLLKQRFVGRDTPSVVLFLNLDPRDVDVNVHPTKREVRFRSRAKVHAEVERTLLEALGTRQSVAYSYSAEGSKCLSEPVVYRDAQQPSLFHGDSGKIGRYRFLGEFASVYMLFEDLQEEQLLLVDKHALHERLLFEQLLEKRQESLPVFLPLDFDLSEWVEYLEPLGFRFEEDGSLLVAVPKWAYGREMSVLKRMVEEGIPVNPSHEEIARVACRAAVKAGDRSLYYDGLKVARILEERGTDLTCPHGRPVVVKLKRSDLDALFKRRM